MRRTWQIKLKREVFVVVFPIVIVAFIVFFVPVIFFKVFFFTTLRNCSSLTRRSWFFLIFFYFFLVSLDTFGKFCKYNKTIREFNWSVDEWIGMPIGMGRGLGEWLKPGTVAESRHVRNSHAPAKNCCC